MRITVQFHAISPGNRDSLRRCHVEPQIQDAHALASGFHRLADSLVQYEPHTMLVHVQEPHPWFFAEGSFLGQAQMKSITEVRVFE